ncbi:MAG: Outer membrane lipoprotein Omp16 [Alphaproteobacteria bacterium MarineAlpha9_Bin4]|nr:MAG: Outer membrane lipoprotein Omp16 [Alphaproteobacteria bacterium MarineAlpha9_Bin4]|tara:strand:+ start:1617 stop:2174 length:558 start_codon:yes stop_codon:yes gene_type:complete
MFLIKKYLYLILVIVLASCTENTKNIPITGADVTSDNNSEDTTIKNQDDSSEIKVSDNASENKKSMEEILIEELIEVGDRVFFDYDESRFKNEGVETLKRQARFLLNNKDLTVRIEGHCDQRGTREYNLALGERRAFSVKSFLVSLGVEESRISVISYGKEKPQSLNENEASWAQNRTAITVINQ